MNTLIGVNREIKKNQFNGKTTPKGKNNPEIKKRLFPTHKFLD